MEENGRERKRERERERRGNDKENLSLSPKENGSHLSHMLLERERGGGEVFISLSFKTFNMC